jgi:hypothetical protein
MPKLVYVVILKFHVMMTLETLSSKDHSVHEVISVKWLQAAHVEVTILGFVELLNSIFAAHTNSFCRM